MGTKSIRPRITKTYHYDNGEMFFICNDDGNFFTGSFGVKGGHRANQEEMLEFVETAVANLGHDLRNAK